MSLRVTHLAFVNTRWYLRFAGAQNEFQAAYSWLKQQPLFFARWIVEYAWPDGKKGAWGIHGKCLGQLKTRFDFSNLKGQSIYSMTSTSHVYTCSFWLEPGNIGKAEHIYYLPR